MNVGVIVGVADGVGVGDGVGVFEGEGVTLGGMGEGARVSALPPPHAVMVKIEMSVNAIL